MNCNLKTTLLLATLFLTAQSLGAKAQLPRFSVQDIGDFGSDCYGMDLNNQGQVAGIAGIYTGNFHGYHAFRYSQGKMTDLTLQTGGQLTEADRINNNGAIAGINSAGYAAVLNGTTVTSLGALGSTTGPYFYSKPFGINNQGQVIGQSVTDTGNPAAFSYTNGALQNLNTLPNSGASAALGINDAGIAVGWVHSTRFDSKGYPYALYDTVMFANGATQILDEGTGFQNQASAINNKNQIAGINKTGAYLYDNGQFTILQPVTPRLAQLQPQRINNRGEIVGQATIGGFAASFYAVNGKGYDLNTLLDPALSGGISIGNAISINDSGQILATGSNSRGQARTFLLTAEVPEPSAPALIGVGVIAMATWIRRRKPGVRLQR